MHTHTGHNYLLISFQNTAFSDKEFLETCSYLLCKVSCNLSYKKIVNNINGYENTSEAERYVYS